MIVASMTAVAQQPPPPAASSAATEVSANPGRPTVSTPATLTPVGYLQFESGVFGAWQAPSSSSQAGLAEVIKMTVHERLELIASAAPFARFTVNRQSANGTGDVLLGAQAVALKGEGARPTIAVSYLRRAYTGNAPDLDINSASNTVILLASADLKGFHYDNNYFFSEIDAGRGARRAQFGQTLSISHPLGKKFGVSGELWHFTQPLLGGRAVGNLWAVNYNARKNLVVDAGFSRGLTSTAVRWQAFAGFTYLLPHNFLRR